MITLSQEELPDIPVLQPTQVDDAVFLLQKEDHAILGGGIDLLPEVASGASDYSAFVSLDQLKELAKVEILGDELMIGSAVTIHELSSNALVFKYAPLLAEAASKVGNPQIRNQGSVLGNLLQSPRCLIYRSGFPCLRRGGTQCPAKGGGAERTAQIVDLGDLDRACPATSGSDLACVLTALGVSIDVKRLSDGVTETRTVPDFLRAALGKPGRATDGLCLRLRLPLTAPQRTAYVKGRVMNGSPLSGIGVAAVGDATTTDAFAVRLVAGGVSDVPLRLLEAEELALRVGPQVGTYTDMLSAALGDFCGPSPMKFALLVELVEEALVRIFNTQQGG